MKTILVAIMVLGLAGTAFGQRGGNHWEGGGRGMRGGAEHSFRGGERHDFGRGFRGRDYRGSGREFRGGYYGHRDGFRRGYGYGRYGYRGSGYGFGYYNYPVVYGAGYYPYCDPAWGPCYYPPYGYGRPGVAISVGVGWHRYGPR